MKAMQASMLAVAVALGSAQLAGCASQSQNESRRTAGLVFDDAALTVGRIAELLDPGEPGADGENRRFGDERHGCLTP